MEKQIKLISFKLKNFKGIKDLTIEFEGNNVNIYGENATGKTTIFDAFKWVFFDKDSSDRKVFNIKTLDSNNKPIHFLKHEVELIATINGTYISFKKMLEEKWVKRRGQAEQEFSGHETKYWIDEVPVSKKDYDEKVNEIIEENLFKLITDPLFFNNMKWQDKRELLLNITEVTATDEDILNSSEELQILLNKLEGRSIEDYRKVIFAKLKELKENKEKIPIRIDELNTTLLDTSEEVDYELLEVNKMSANTRIEEIDKILLDVQKRAEESSKIVNTLAIKKNELNNFQNKLENEQKQLISNKKMELTNKKNEISNKIRNNTINIEGFKQKIESYNNECTELRKQWDIANLKKYEEPGEDFVCPVCKQNLPAEQQSKKLEELKNNFDSHKKTELDNINSQGKSAKANLTQYEKWLEEKQNENLELENELHNIEVELKKLEEDMNNAKAINPLENEEFKKLCDEVKELEKQVNDRKNTKILPMIMPIIMEV